MKSKEIKKSKIGAKLYTLELTFQTDKNVKYTHKIQEAYFL